MLHGPQHGGSTVNIQYAAGVLLLPPTREMTMTLLLFFRAGLLIGVYLDSVLRQKQT